MTIQVAWWFDVICVFVWHSEWSWDVVSTCVDFSFEGLAPLRHPSLLGGRAWARQAAGLCRVFLFCWWHNVIESSMFEVSMVWQPDNRNEILTIWESFPIISRSHPSCLEVSGGSCTETHKVTKCHVKNVMCPFRHLRCTENAIDWTGKVQELKVALNCSEQKGYISWYWTT